MERRSCSPLMLTFLLLLGCLSVYQMIGCPGPPEVYEPSPSNTYNLNLNLNSFQENNYNNKDNKNNNHTDPTSPNSNSISNLIESQTLPPWDYTTLINLDNFRFKILNKNCQNESVDLLVLVHSAPGNLGKRNTIRQTWGHVHQENGDTTTKNREHKYKNQEFVDTSIRDQEFGDTSTWEHKNKNQENQRTTKQLWGPNNKNQENQRTTLWGHNNKNQESADKPFRGQKNKIQENEGTTIWGQHHKNKNQEFGDTLNWGYKNQNQENEGTTFWGHKYKNQEYVGTTTVKVVFLLGDILDSDEQGLIEKENNIFGDIIQGNFVDAYRNMTYKHVMALKYAVYHCPQAKYVLKTDDDIFVNMPAVLNFLNGDYLTTTTTSGTKKLILCTPFYDARVKRSYRSKWRVSFKEYPDPYYPPYCPGWALLYSPDTVFRLYREAQRSEYFWIDDVYITGIIAKRINLTHVPIKNFVLTPKQVDYILKYNETIYNDLVFNLGSYLYGPPDLQQNTIIRLWKIFNKAKSKNNVEKNKKIGDFR